MDVSAHCMIDLETLGIEHDAAILSIGAVIFDPNNPEHVVLDEFHVGVDVTSHLRLGASVTGGTFDWWMHPSRDAARIRLFHLVKVDIASVLDGFARWFGDSKPTWGNGASFDNTVLKSAFGHIGREAPWNYYHERCFRTLKNVATAVPKPINEHEHDALEDARAQAFHLKDIVQALELAL